MFVVVHWILFKSIVLLLRSLFWKTRSNYFRLLCDVILVPLRKPKCHSYIHLLEDYSKFKNETTKSDPKTERVKQTYVYVYNLVKYFKFWSPLLLTAMHSSSQYQIRVCVCVCCVCVMYVELSWEGKKNRNSIRKTLSWFSCFEFRGKNNNNAKENKTKT